MDPNFIPILFSQLNERTQILNLAKQEVDEKRKEQELLENREKLLDFSKKESDVLLHESSLHPQQVLIRTQILLNQMNDLKVTPDSYETQTEKEGLVLLWRKLIGISDKTRKQMTQEQFDQCQKCLEAIWMQGFIQTIAQQLKAYNEFQQIKTDLEQKRSYYKKMERIWYIILIVILSFLIWLLAIKQILDEPTEFFGVLLILGFWPWLIIRNWFLSQNRKIENTFRKYRQGNEEESFWSIVREKFNGIPTREILEQRWKEQEEIIKVIFEGSSL